MPQKQVWILFNFPRLSLKLSIVRKKSCGHNSEKDNYVKVKYDKINQILQRNFRFFSLRHFSLCYLFFSFQLIKLIYEGTTVIQAEWLHVRIFQFPYRVI